MFHAWDPPPLPLGPTLPSPWEQPLPVCDPPPLAPKLSPLDLLEPGLYWEFVRRNWLISVLSGPETDQLRAETGRPARAHRTVSVPGREEECGPELSERSMILFSYIASLKK